MAHPAKKKHQNRPRKIPIVPLTDEQREKMSNQEFRKALSLAKEAEIVSKLGSAPSACVHSAYFAMEHCAGAAILRYGGVGAERSFPRRHQDIILHIERLTADETGDMRGFGDSLKEVYLLREAADYFVSRDPTNSDATFAVEQMHKYLNAIRAKWHFSESSKLPPDSNHG
jgi:uncharacterized protein (UPF0332 family)